MLETSQFGHEKGMKVQHWQSRITVRAIAMERMICFIIELFYLINNASSCEAGTV
jgi:hypothetical protein